LGAIKLFSIAEMGQGSFIVGGVMIIVVVIIFFMIAVITVLNKTAVHRISFHAELNFWTRGGVRTPPC
jgi:hypothetical protein